MTAVIITAIIIIIMAQLYDNEMNSMATGHNLTSNVEDDAYKVFYEVAQFTTGLIIYPFICLIGITGNTLTLMVLQQPKMVTSTNVFLSALAVADLIKLLNDTLYFIVSILMRTNATAGNQMMGYMYPFSHYIFNESVCVASWLTVCIGIERYIYVCHATRVHQWCTVMRARLISSVFFVVMSLIAIPSALRYEKTTVLDGKSNQTMFEISLTELGQNQPFMSWYMWIINLLRSVIPLCVLVVLNACIIQALRKQQLKGKEASKNRITIMLIIVIVVFMVCVTPDAVMSTVFGFGYVEAGYLVKGVREFTDMLLSVNSALNFIIYCLCSQTFRDTFNGIFCHQTTPITEQCKTSKHSTVRNSPVCSRLDEEFIELETKPLTNGEYVSMYGGPQEYV